MKVNDIVESIGYVNLKDKEKVTWPSWLLKGKHRISNVKHNGFGTLVQTDRQPVWMNSDWFR